MIRLGGGKELTFIANRVSAQNQYIQSAELNSQPLNRPRSWGSALEDASPSMSTEDGAAREPEE